MEQVPLSSEQKRMRGGLMVTAFVLFVIFMLGMFFIAANDLEQSAILTLSFVAGLSMIFLPCTLPLVFIIVPLSMGSGYKKGLLIALLFGLGLSITLSLYGVAIAALGGWLGLATATEYMFLVAGTFAFVFGLAQLGFLKLRIPGYGGKIPDVIQKQGDYLKSFFLGLFLGNAGVGCPNPAFYVLLAFIAKSGDPAQGWFLGFVHGMGRAIPLIFISILAILGVSATGWLVSKKEKVERMIGWFLAYIGAFIFMNGAFGHEWYVQSGIHQMWEKVIAWFFNTIAPIIGLSGLSAKFGELVENHHDVISSVWYRSGNWVMVILFAIPLIWNYYARKNDLKVLEAAMPRDEAKIGELEKRLGRMFWKYAAIIFTFVVLFVRVIPATVLPPEGGSDAIFMRTSAGYGRAITLTGDKYTAELGISSPIPQAGMPLEFSFTIRDKATAAPFTNLEIVHEKPMHVVLVRDDLTQFAHIHPALRGNSYVAPFAFMAPGKYKLWADFTYRGETHIFDFLIDTEDAVQQSTLMRQVSREGVFNGYEVRLLSSVPERGKSGTLSFEVRRPDGSMPVMGTFLGARGHLVAISENLAEFMHTHAEGGDHEGGHMDDGRTDNTHGLRVITPVYGHGGGEEPPVPPPNRLDYEITFSSPGFYKLWPQFVADGTEVTAEFLVEVK